MNKHFPILRSPRLRLRALTPADGPALFAIHSDAEWMRWYGVDPLVDEAQGQQLAELFAGWFTAGTGYRWALERKEDKRLIGTCGLFRWNKSWHNCVTGYEIARDCQGQGYMREALEVILDFGFNMMMVHRIQAETHPDNLASIALLERLGFRFEGMHREQAFWGGRFYDLNCFSLLEQEWRAGKREHNRPAKAASGEASGQSG
ncbi:GNAT family N-acetyltransferase [Noviherbaspirillum galbum]|uniref:GNAT family N-acetyltransferase n=1 Tax=Noviherbaspirillum galbum TaxID=2709383 RepID=A0A6B3SN31_9BURK|nr:GNAT family protein [Noviherbaspirillum galbum]NEX59792.1 GNAT family N-acetyltransferase [Noviherbaspirillum galbum]